METGRFTDSAAGLANNAKALATQAEALMAQASQLNSQAHPAGGGDSFVFLVMIFVLSCFIGYYVVWSVTPALHSPLMSVTNAISSVIIVGALIAAGPAEMSFSKVMGFAAVLLASINIFGGFIVSQRMLRMYRKKK